MTFLIGRTAAGESASPVSAMGARARSFLLYAAALVCAVLLFAGEGRFGVRSLDRAWDLGHLPAFGLFTYLLVTRKAGLSRQPFARLLLSVVPIVAVASLAVEGVQSLIGRTFSIFDIFRNLLGSTAVLIFFATARNALTRRTRLTWQLLIVSLVVLQLLPLARALVDETIAWRRFPVLSDFETRFELDRWSGGPRLHIDHTMKSQGAASLRVDLQAGSYSGAYLAYFPRDWRGFSALHIDLCNPDPAPIRITVRVSDKAHDRHGYRYTDRFNRSYLLGPGWTAIDIPMDDLRSAPRGRAMELQKISSILIFSKPLDRARAIYLDNLRLVP